MPHGIGAIYNKNGEKLESNWVMGIDSDFL
jgi:hypothetical protein